MRMFFFAQVLQSGLQRNPKTHVSDIEISEPKLVKQKSDIKGPVRVKESALAQLLASDYLFNYE